MPATVPHRRAILVHQEDPLRLVRDLATEIVESAIDWQSRRIYVVPQSSSSAARLPDVTAHWQSWRPRLVRHICVTPAGEPDFARLAEVRYVDDDLVRTCQATLRDPARAVAVAREYWEPATLIFERQQTAGASPPPQSVTQVSPAELERLPIAHARGPELAWSGPCFTTLVEALESHATSTTGISYAEGGQLEFESYAQLLAAARRVLHGLRKLGLRKGDPLPLQITDRRLHFHVFWGCALGGIIPVTIAIPPRYEPDNPVFQKLVGVWKLLGGRHIMASTDNMAPLRKLLPGDAVLCDVADLDLSADGEPERLTGDDVLFYQLTSGSTGTPKCIPETHAAVISHIRHSVADVGYTAEDRTLNWLPFDHVVPMLTCHLKDVYLGCHAFQAPTHDVLANPLLWLDLMAQHRIHYSWSPNFGFKLASTAARKQQAADGGRPPSWDLSCLKRLMNAGEQVTTAVCDEFLAVTRLRPEVMQPAFGMAEVATCMTYNNQYGQPHGVHRILKSSLSGVLREADSTANETDVLPLVDLGPPSPGVEIRITDQGSDRVLRENQVGHLQIRGPCVMRGYHNNPTANSESFVGEGWFDSGDLGFITGGRLVLSGRAKEMIIVRGANFYAYEIEDHVATLAGCRPAFIAATSLHSPTTGTEGLLIFFVPDPAIVPDVALKNLKHGHLHPILKKIVAEIHSRVASSFGVNPDFVIPLPDSEFLKTTSGKIQRTAFKNRFLAGDYRQVCRTLRGAFPQHGACVPDWFCRPVWQPRRLANADPQDAPSADDLFVFQPNAFRLAQALGTTNVFPAPDHAALDRLRDRVSINPQGTVRVILATPGGSPASDAPPADDADASVEHLIALGRGLADVRGRVELYVLSHGAFQATAADLSRPEQLARRVCLTGMVKAMAAELPCLARTAQIDIDDGLLADPMALAAALRSEMLCPSPDQEVALRGGARYVRRFANVGESLVSEISSTQGDERWFRPGAAYVVTGGLGGIGVGIVRQILDVEGTSVLILGRRHDVGPQLARHGWADGSQNSRVAYRAIELGRDPNELEQSIRQFVRDRGQPLAGIVHLAGAYQRTPVAELTPAAWADALRAKVNGSMHLHRALKSLAPEGPPPQFLHFGSVAAIMAGHGLAAYAAACRFQEEFAVWQRADGVDSRVLAWSIWEETGLGGRDRALGFAPWVCPLTPERGWSLCQTLAGQTSQPLLYVGANPRHPDFARLSADATDLGYHALCVFHTAEAELDVAQIEMAAGAARYVCVPRLPDSGGPEGIAALRTASIKSLVAREQAGPRNPIEQTLFAVWKAVLGVASLDRDDNFFELGGDSLLWMDMASRLARELNIRVDAGRLMQFGTIAQLAEFVAGRAATAADHPRGAASGPTHDLLVTLKQGTDPALAPVFLFPTIAGTTSCFNELLSRVEAARPVVGINDPYLKGDRLSAALSFEAWMDRYADAIQARQPAGPYTLLSYSQGSTWLWGTADRLLRRGATIDRCILLDPFFPAWNGGQQGFRWLAKWLQVSTYPYVPRLVLRAAVGRVMAHIMGLGGAMQTQRQREVSLARAYDRFTRVRENIWLFALFMEMDTGHRLLKNYGELKNYPRAEHEDYVDFLCARAHEKLEGKVERQYIKDVLYVMACAFLRASACRPVTLPAATRVTIVAPHRHGLSLAKEAGFDRLVAPGCLREIDVALEPFDKGRHLTAKLRRLYRPFELHYRCMHDPRFIAECVKLLRDEGIARA